MLVSELQRCWCIFLPEDRAKVAYLGIKTANRGETASLACLICSKPKVEKLHFEGIMCFAILVMSPSLYSCNVTMRLGVSVCQCVLMSVIELQKCFYTDFFFFLNLQAEPELFHPASSLYAPVLNLQCIGIFSSQFGKNRDIHFSTKLKLY